MAVTLSAQALPSVSSIYMLSGQISGWGGPTRDIYIGRGIRNAGAPSVWSDLTSSTVDPMMDWSDFTIHKGAGVFTATFQIPIFSFGSAGDSVWIVMFNGNPSGSTVPLAVAGPLLQSA